MGADEPYCFHVATTMSSAGMRTKFLRGPATGISHGAADPSQEMDRREEALRRLPLREINAETEETRIERYYYECRMLADIFEHVFRRSFHDMVQSESLPGESITSDALA